MTKELTNAEFVERGRDFLAEKLINKASLYFLKEKFLEALQRLEKLEKEKKQNDQ